MQGFSGQLGESYDSVLAEENLSPAFEVPPAFQRSLAQDWMEGCSEGLSQPNPRILFQPQLLHESPCSWSWQHLGGPKQGPGAIVLISLSQHQLFPATDSSTTGQATAESMARCQRGSMGKASLSRQLGRGPALRDSSQSRHICPERVPGVAEPSNQLSSGGAAPAAAEGLAKRRSGPSPGHAMCSLESHTGAWEHLPRQVTRQGQEAANKGMRREATGDSGQGHSSFQQVLIK